MAERTVGSPPDIRSWAPATSAALKKTPTTLSSRALASPAKATTASTPPSSEATPDRSDTARVGSQMASSTPSEARKERTGSTSSSRSCRSTRHDTLANVIVLEMRPMRRP